MSADSVFLDTNVVVYAASRNGIEDSKRRRALEILELEKFATSAQVLQEFFVTVTRKSKAPISPEEALEWIDQFLVFPCYAIDYRLVKVAIETAARYSISYWDAAILAAADALQCKTVYSEDLNNGQVYGRVRVVNPFLVH